jgi:hypothetical protein
LTPVKLQVFQRIATRDISLHLLQQLGYQSPVTGRLVLEPLKKVGLAKTDAANMSGLTLIASGSERAQVQAWLEAMRRPTAAIQAPYYCGAVKH